MEKHSSISKKNSIDNYASTARVQSDLHSEQNTFSHCNVTKWAAYKICENGRKREANRQAVNSPEVDVPHFSSARVQ